MVPAKEVLATPKGKSPGAKWWKIIKKDNNSNPLRSVFNNKQETFFSWYIWKTCSLSWHIFTGILVILFQGQKPQIVSPETWKSLAELSLYLESIHPRSAIQCHISVSLCTCMYALSYNTVHTAYYLSLCHIPYVWELTPLLGKELSSLKSTATCNNSNTKWKYLSLTHSSFSYCLTVSEQINQSDFTSLRNFIFVKASMSTQHNQISKSSRSRQHTSEGKLFQISKKVKV